MFHYYLGSGRRGDRVRKIMAGGVVAGQHAHMELVLKAENEALEAQKLEAAPAAAPATTKSTAAAAAGEKVISLSLSFCLVAPTAQISSSSTLLPWIWEVEAAPVVGILSFFTRLMVLSLSSDSRLALSPVFRCGIR